MKNQLLIVSYHFPPVISAGVSRLKGLVKYLGRFGWDISVITVRRSYVEGSGPPGKNGLGGVRMVVRTGSLEIDRFNPRRLTGAEGAGDPQGRRCRGVFKRGIAALLRYPYAFLHKLLSFPDRQIGWFLPLLITLVKAIRKTRAELILSSSPPHSSHIPIAILKPFLRFRWIVDFRDPWTVPPYYYGNRLSLGMARVLERIVLRTSDRIIANTPGNKEALLKEFPFLEESKITVVTNGFDTEVGTAGSEMENHETNPDILYLGEVYEGMLDLYLEALKVMIGEKYSRIPRLGVYGSIDPSYSRRFEGAEFKGYLLYMGKVSYEKSIALMRGAKALLLALPHSTRGKTWVPSKLYPYLFSGRPILAVGPQGDASRIIESCKAGVTIYSTEPEIVAGEIKEFFTRIEQGRVDAREEEEIARYSMKSIASRLEAVLREEAELLK